MHESRSLGIGALLAALVTTIALPCHSARAAEAEKVPSSDDRFAVRNVEGWTVYVNREVRRQHADALDRTLEHLRWELYQITLAVPPDAATNMQENNAIWIEYDEKVRLSYHPSRQWLIDHGYTVPRGPESFMSLSVRTHVGDSYRHPFVVFHELAHGYDFHFIGNGKRYGNDECEANYQRMMKTGTYEKVRIWDGRKGSHYGRTNRMEYWAESSEAYFAVNDIYPFVRAELREHDPTMARVVERYWGVDPSEVLQLEKELAAYKAEMRQAPRLVKPRTAAPASEYDTRAIKGWTVHVSPALTSQPGLCDAMVKLLTYKLHTINHFIAPEGQKQLHGVPIWLEIGGKGPYLRYCGDREQLKREGAPAEKFRSVEVRDPQRMRKWALLQQSDVLHEVALAYYDLYAAPKASGLGRKIRAAYAEAVKGGKYKSVLHFDGSRSPHPGLADERVYFAELMESYFLVNDHYPFIRCELKDQDAAGYALVAGLWQGNPRR
jgi:hypothetical protein